jgi:hypothetical protein
MSLPIIETLYHGTVYQINTIDVTKGRNNKDFGQGFYMATSLNIKYFEKADMEWLDFVLMCREQGGTPHNYDLVIGPTADDNTLLCLRAYWQELYGEIGSKEAKEVLLKNLEPENLGTQYFIGKQDIAEKLIKSFIEIKWS